MSEPTQEKVLRALLRVDTVGVAHGPQLPFVATRLLLRSFPEPAIRAGVQHYAGSEEVAREIWAAAISGPSPRGAPI